MEPNTPVRSSHDIVTLRNPDDEDFTFEYDRSRGNYPYTMKAGGVSRFPRFLADHAVKKLIDRILDKRKVKLNNEPARAELREMIFVEEEIFQQAPQEAEAIKLHKEVDALNRPSDLDKVLARTKEKEKATEQPSVPVPAPPPAEELPKEEEKFAGLDDRKEAKKAGFVGPTVDTTKEIPVTASAPKPTRLQVLKFAEDKMGLTLDKKTMSKFDKMTDDQLIAEVQYPIE